MLLFYVFLFSTSKNACVTFDDSFTDVFFCQGKPFPLSFPPLLLAHCPPYQSRSQDSRAFEGHERRDKTTDACSTVARRREESLTHLFRRLLGVVAEKETSEHFIHPPLRSFFSPLSFSFPWPMRTARSHVCPRGRFRIRVLAPRPRTGGDLFSPERKPWRRFHRAEPFLSLSLTSAVTASLLLSRNTRTPAAQLRSTMSDRRKGSGEVSHEQKRDGAKEGREKPRRTKSSVESKTSVGSFFFKPTLRQIAKPFFFSLLASPFPLLLFPSPSLPTARRRKYGSQRQQRAPEPAATKQQQQQPARRPPRPRPRPRPSRLAPPPQLGPAPRRARRRQGPRRTLRARPLQDTRLQGRRAGLRPVRRSGPGDVARQGQGEGGEGRVRELGADGARRPRDCRRGGGVQRRRERRQLQGSGAGRAGEAAGGGRGGGAGGEEGRDRAGRGSW